MAAETNVDNSIKETQLFLENNIKSTYNLLEYALKHLHNIKTFEYLSLGALIDNKIFCIHGGLSPRLNKVNGYKAAGMDNI